MISHQNAEQPSVLQQDLGEWIPRVTVAITLQVVYHSICFFCYFSLHWRHNKRDGVSNHRRFDGLLYLLFRRRSKKTFKLCVSGLCERNSSATVEPPPPPPPPPHKGPETRKMFQFSIWSRHQVLCEGGGGGGVKAPKQNLLHGTMLNNMNYFIWKKKAGFASQIWFRYTLRVSMTYLVAFVDKQLTQKCLL